MYPLENGVIRMNSCNTTILYYFWEN